MSVLLLELNEVNFDAVEAYVARGDLPVLGRLIARHGIVQTVSESRYDDLEPWIQWVTAHTGLTLAEHGVFRLGDIVDAEIDQIWEVLERQGLSVGAISPMNASNRCAAPAFFMPDPWTRTKAAGPASMIRLYEPIASAVNDNAKARLGAADALRLLRGMARYARLANYPRYVGMATDAARGRHWARAMVLDALLGDMFVDLVRRRRPQFASLFLNAAAHIQHHYMFNSAVYHGGQVNPGWYASPGADPVFEVYALYDRIVGQIAARFPDAHLMIATGLHQEPHGATTFYWRLRDHAAFLRAAGVSFASVEPRMSRDFVIFCEDAEQARLAADQLLGISTAAGEALFTVDNRGDSLFVTLAWPNDLPPGLDAVLPDGRRLALREHCAFVAIKNGEHDGVGYLIDSGAVAGGGERQIALASLPERIAEACGVDWSPRRSMRAAARADPSAAAVGALVG